MCKHFYEDIYIQVGTYSNAISADFVDIKHNSIFVLLSLYELQISVTNIFIDICSFAQLNQNRYIKQNTWQSGYMFCSRD